MAVVLIDIYRMTISSALTSVFGGGCRFTPTCSSYARQAFLTHGIFKGFYLSSKRILRCHPWGDYGVDPVEDAK